MIVEFLLGVLVGMGIISILWIRCKRQAIKRIKELEQKIREVKVQLWLAWGHKEKYGGE